jgi:phosphatidylserine/phosphatidylglycerophosphate/cardiolipin synthase-like enzyme
MIAETVITTPIVDAVPAPADAFDFINDNITKISQQAFNIQDFSTSVGKLSHAELNPADIINKIINSAKNSITGEANQAILEGCKNMVNWTMDNYLTKKAGVFDILFFPSKDNEAKLLQFFKNAKKSILVCVFTISNHHIANALREAHERKLDVRIVTDDLFAAKAESDVQDMAREGIPVRVDDSKSALMHNKFAVIDDRYLITGSYNWTAQATYYNQENIVIIENKHGVKTFKEHFEELWIKYAAFNFDKLIDTAHHKTKLYENQIKEDEIKHHKEEREEKKKAKEENGGSARPKRKAKADEDSHSDKDDKSPKLSKGSKNIKHEDKKPAEKSSPKRRNNRAKVAKD